MLPVVALVGRPNVGKSTLFNVLTRSRDALVADMPGVTRDRHYGVCRSGERPFVVVDTGGLSGVEDAMDVLTAKQVRLAIEEAQVLVFVVDARDGLLPQDYVILNELRRSGKTDHRGGQQDRRPGRTRPCWRSFPLSALATFCRCRPRTIAAPRI